MNVFFPSNEFISLIAAFTNLALSFFAHFPKVLYGDGDGLLKTFQVFSEQFLHGIIFRFHHFELQDL